MYLPIGMQLLILDNIVSSNFQRILHGVILVQMFDLKSQRKATGFTNLVFNLTVSSLSCKVKHSLMCQNDENSNVNVF